MRVLLDTHVLLWYLQGGELPQQVIDILENRSNDRLVSVVSLWGLSIKINLNKLETSRPLADIHQHLTTELGIKILNIEFVHLNTLLSLPHHHRDPFDRLLIAQAITEDVNVISADRYFPMYPVTVIW